MELYDVKWAVTRMRSIAGNLQRAPEIAREVGGVDERDRRVALETAVQDGAEALLCEAASLEQSMKEAPTVAPVEA